MAVRGRFWIGVWLLATLGALWAVIARSTAGLRLARSLRETRQERVQLEARRSALERRLLQAQSRAVLVPRAEARLGLRLPADSEIVILSVPAARPR
jgi:hypothetical protein